MKKREDNKEVERRNEINKPSSEGRELDFLTESDDTGLSFVYELRFAIDTDSNIFCKAHLLLLL